MVRSARFKHTRLVTVQVGGVQNVVHPASQCYRTHRPFPGGSRPIELRKCVAQSLPFQPPQNTTVLAIVKVAGNQERQVMPPLRVKSFNLTLAVVASPEI